MLFFSPKDGKTEASAPKKQSDQYLHYVICKHCFNNPTKTLDNATVGLSNSRITNFKMNHMKTHHHMSLEEFLSSQTCASTISSLSNSSSTTKSKGTTTQTSLAHFKKPKTQSKDDQIKSLHSLIYNFINDNNLPMHTNDKQDFWDMLMYSHNTGALFEHLVEKDLKFGQRKFEQIRSNSISNTTMVISSFIKRSRCFYKDSTGKQQGFISVCHDLWDGKFRELLGLSITFIDTISMKLFLIPLGLITAKGKKPLLSVNKVSAYSLVFPFQNKICTVQ